MKQNFSDVKCTLPGPFRVQHLQEKVFLLLKINSVLVCSIRKCFINLSSLSPPPTFLGFFLIYWNSTWQLFFLWVYESYKQIACLLNMSQRSLILWILKKNKILMKNLRFFSVVGCLPYCSISVTPLFPLSFKLFCCSVFVFYLEFLGKIPRNHQGKGSEPFDCSL